MAGSASSPEPGGEERGRGGGCWPSSCRSPPPPPDVAACEPVPGVGGTGRAARTGVRSRSAGRLRSAARSVCRPATEAAPCRRAESKLDYRFPFAPSDVDLSLGTKDGGLCLDVGGRRFRPSLTLGPQGERRARPSCARSRSRDALHLRRVRSDHRHQAEGPDPLPLLRLPHPVQDADQELCALPLALARSPLATHRALPHLLHHAQPPPFKHPYCAHVEQPKAPSLTDISALCCSDPVRGSVVALVRAGCRSCLQ